MKAAYPTFYKTIDDADLEVTANLWEDMFKDEPAPLVTAAVKAFIATDEHGYPPHIGAIKKSIADLTRGEQLTEVEAWQIAKKAMSAYATHEEFMALPPAIRRAVGSASQLVQWAMQDISQIGVTQSNFMRSYRTAIEAENKTAMLPQEVRALIGKVNLKQLSEGDDTSASDND